MLYRAFGWEDTMPQFAHLPLLLKPDGNGKLSKRDGDRLGFPVFPLDWHNPETGEISSGYRERGYLPEAVVNMLALLGWNPGNDQELMTMDELIKLFSIEHISKSGAKFNVEKAKWFNHEYLQKCSDERIAEMFLPQLKEHGIDAPMDYVVKVCGMMKERISFPSELWDQTHYFFVAPTEYDPKAVAKRWKPGMTTHMAKVIEILNTVPFEYDAIHQALLEDYIKGHELNMGQIMNSLRLAVVGTTVGPDMLTLVMTIGKEETIARVQRAIDTIGEIENKQE
jgi:glutamyl-tRNA synthetase